MSAVWNLADVTSTQKLVLLALADNANDDGSCYPSMALLARKTCLSDRAVRGTMRDLETAQLVRSEARPGTSTLYRLMVPPRNEVPPSSGAPLRAVTPVTPEAGSALPSEETPERGAGEGGTTFPPPRNVVPPTPERGSGDPGTSFRLTTNEPSKEPSINHHQPSVVPAVWTDWAVWWRQHGVTVDATDFPDRRRFCALAAKWIAKGISTEQMAAAVSEATATAKGAIGYLPSYAWTVLCNGQGREARATAGQRSPTKSQQNAAVAAALAGSSAAPARHPAMETIDVDAREIG